MSQFFLNTAAGGGSLSTLSDDVATVVSPLAGNIQLVGHVVEQGATKFSTVKAGTNLLNINPMSSSRWIVDPLGFNGTHTTIPTALASATSGDTIFLLPGTYTLTTNLTWKAGVNLSAYNCDSLTPNVIITANGGSLSLTYSGTASFSGIQFEETTSTVPVDLSGANATVANFFNCSGFCNNDTAANIFEQTGSNAASNMNFYSCTFDTNQSSGNYIVNSGSGSLVIQNCTFYNTGAQTVALSLTGSTSTTQINNSSFYSQITLNGGGTATLSSCLIDCSAINAAGLLTQTTGTFNVYECYIAGGSASAVNIATGTTAKLYNCTISSSNTNAITGAGTLNYSGLSFSGTSFLINTTTQVGGTLKGGKFQAPSTGFLGEVLSNTGSLSISSSTPTQVCSLSITAGNWMVFGTVVATATTNMAFIAGSVNPTTATFTTVGIDYNQSTIDTLTAPQSLNTPIQFFSLTATTNYFLNIESIFTGTGTASGKIQAVRIG